MKKYLEEIKVIVLLIIMLNVTIVTNYSMKEILHLKEQIQILTRVNQSLKLEVEDQEEINFLLRRLFASNIKDVNEPQFIGLNAGNCVLEKGNK